MTNFELAILTTTLGIIIGLLFGWRFKSSLVLWRFFKPNDAEISAYKKQKLKILRKALENNNEKILDLKKDNEQVQKTIDALV